MLAAGGGAKNVLWPPGSALSDPVGKSAALGKRRFLWMGWAPASTSLLLRDLNRPDIPKFSGKETRKSDLEPASFQVQPVHWKQPLPQDFPEKAHCARGATLGLLLQMPLRCIAALSTLPGYGLDPSPELESCTVSEWFSV